MSKLDYAEIGQRIKELRKKKGYSQQELADMLRKSLRTVQKYETGEIEIPISVLDELSSYLNTTPTFILGYQKDTSPVTNFADVIQLLFKLEDVPGIRFDIEVKKPPRSDGWVCSLVFNGKERKSEWNQDMCLFLEEWSDERDDLSITYGRPTLPSVKDDYRRWKDRTLAYYAGVSLEDESQDND